MDNIVTDSRRCFPGAIKAGPGDFSSENRETRTKPAQDKYFLDAKNFASCAIFRGEIFFAKKNQNRREDAPGHCRNGGRTISPARHAPRCPPNAGLMAPRPTQTGAEPGPLGRGPSRQAPGHFSNGGRTISPAGHAPRSSPNAGLMAPPPTKPGSGRIGFNGQIKKAPGLHRAP